MLSLRQRGYRDADHLEHLERGRLATVRFMLPRSESLEPDVDLLFASSGIEPEVVRGAQTMSCGVAGEVPVARVGHLIAMKVLSENDVRLQDLADIQALLRVASPDELDEARRLLQLITERRFHRGKDLESRLSALVERFGS